jgi:DNA-binding NarL/FixJ family response regulator
MRVALADDSALARRGFTSLLRAAGHEVVYSAADGDRLVAALDAALDTAPADVALLDVRMPPGPEGGLRTAQRLRAAHPTLGLLLVSHRMQLWHLPRVLALGAAAGAGYRLKDRLATVAALGDTLARVAAGDIVIEPGLGERLVDATSDRVPPTMTPGQRQVLGLLAEAATNDRIAAELTVTAATADRIVATVLATLDVPPTAAAGPAHRALAVLRRLGMGEGGD